MFSAHLFNFTTWDASRINLINWLINGVLNDLHKFVLLVFNELFSKAEVFLESPVSAWDFCVYYLLWAENLDFFSHLHYFWCTSTGVFTIVPHNCDVSRCLALVSEVKAPHFHREANAVNNGCERINRKTLPLSFPLLEIIFLGYDVHVVVIKMRF